MVGMPSKLTGFRIVLGVLTTGLAMINVAQTQPPAEAQSRFKARAELVTVPVVVTDRSGAHVQNLKKEDFVVLEDGKEQKISTFEEIQKPAGPLRRNPPQPNQFSNVLPGESSPTRLTIIVLDMINTPFSDQAYAKRELLKYLADSIDSSQPTSLMVITRSGLKVIHDFTTDPQILTAALKKVQGQRQLVEEASQEAIPQGEDQVSQAVGRLMEFQRESEQAMESFQRRVAIIETLQAMQQIAQSAAGLPGRKALVWASAGFPFSINDTTMVLTGGGPRLDSLADVLPLYEQTWKVLNQSQIAVYPVDVRGLVNPGFINSQTRNPQRDYYARAMWRNADTLGTFQVFAQATGGRAFYNTNDLNTAFRKAADDNASYYLLGYYLDRPGKKIGWHKLGVRVHHEGAQIRARSGFFLTPPEAELNDKTAMQLALNSRLAYTAIPITARWQDVQPAAEGKKRIIFLLTLPRNSAEIDESDNNHMLLEFAVLARTGAGVVGDVNANTMEGHLKPESVKKIRENGVDYRGALTISPGEYTVHFAVQDRLAGRIGSVIAPLKVEP
jgi:VWFA-related protein